MTKDELLKNSASTVRSNPTLFAEFKRLYQEEGHDLSGCVGCSFANNFNAWRDKHIKSKTVKVMSKSNGKNTFVIHRNYSKLYVPYINEVITKDSSDELVIQFLNQDGGKYFEGRAKNFFEKLPDALTEKSEPKEEVMVEKEAVSPPKKKRKRRTRAEIEADKEKKDS